jgi:hypothetical protein
MADDDGESLDAIFGGGVGAGNVNLPDETAMEQMSLDQFNEWIAKAERVWQKRNLPSVEDMPENLFRQYVQSQMRDPNRGMKD